MKEVEGMATVARIPAADIQEKVASGNSILVCAYDDDAKFQSYHLEGAIPLSKFKTKLADLAMDTEIIFYCA